jgi:hypothetical protein
MSDATSGFGSTLSFSDLGVTYTDVAQTVDLSGPEPEIGDVKITNNDSPNRSHEYMPGGGLIEPGEQDFEVVYTKTQCAALYTMFGDGLEYFWRETYPDGSKWEYKGYIKKFGTEAPTEDESIRNSITLKLTTKPAFTAAA